IIWLASRCSQVAPPSDERNSAEALHSTSAYTIRGSDGAYTTSTRPHGVAGRPLLAVIGAQVRPASVERNMPLALAAFGPSPPDRNVQPWRRKSHIPAISTSEFLGSIATLEQPVEPLPPLSTSDQVLPPSAVLYSPRSFESLHSLPGTHAYTIPLDLGCTMICTMRSDSGSPAWVQVSPPSVDL